MSIPLIQIYRVGRYILEQKFRGVKRYPLVLMLEPLFQCNLACAGCGKIDYPAEILQKRVSTEDALKAVDECGAPVVSIPGGEPLIHKEMPAIVRGIIARKKFVYLCTNALLLEQKIDEYEPSPYFTWSVHLDGNRERHDESVCRQGVFEKAVS
ncbi:MAG: adenosyl-hopene transferase HpnH, partial [Gammaproteobacteria bacterium]|nr:adenosyl-hopene transferase HpnH [Gammaproteobacteria bacterium]